MTGPIENIPNALLITPDEIIAILDGEEWSLVEDLTTRARPNTWVNIDRAICRPVHEVVADLENLP